MRTSLCHDLFLARLSRMHNDANVLSMGARVVAPTAAPEIVRVWLGMTSRAVATSRAWSGSHASSEGAVAMGDREYAADWEALKATDPEVATAIASELERERTQLRLIASENYASPAVLAAIGFDDEQQVRGGYQGRYYGGCEFVDITEQLAIDRAKELFGADHANVQPHAGAQANMAVFGAFLTPNDPSEKVLGMVLAHGTRLTHGSPVNVSGMWFNFVGYEVDREASSSTWTASATSPRSIGRRSCWRATPPIRGDRFRRIPRDRRRGGGPAVGRREPLHRPGGGRGLPSPVPHADVVTFTTHKALRGPRGAMILCREEHAKAIDKAVFPMMQGGPLEHCIAGKAVALKEASTPEFRDYAERTVRDARAGRRPRRRGAHRLGRHRLPPAARRPAALGIDGKTAEAVSDEVGIALNKNQIPFDPNPRPRPRGSGSAPRAVDARHGRARDARDREHHGRCAEEPRRRRCEGEGASAGP